MNCTDIKKENGNNCTDIKKENGNIYYNPSRPNPRRKEKIMLSFYFRTSLWCLKRFYEGLIETCQMILLSFYLKSDFMYSVS